MGDVRQMALAEIARLKKTYGIAAEDVLGHEELAMLREGHGHVAAEGTSPGERFVASASLEYFLNTSVPLTVDVPVLEPHELAATVDFPNTETLSDANAVAELGSAVFDLVTAEPITSGLTVRPVSASGTEITGIGLIPGAQSKEWTLTAPVPEEDMIRFSAHANEVPLRDIRDSPRARRIIDTLVTRLWRRQVALEILTGTGAINGDRQELSGLEAATIASVDATTGNKVDHVIDAVATVNEAWDSPVHVVGRPSDLAILLKESAFRRDRYPTVERFVPFGLLPAGTVYVAALRSIVLHATALVVEVSTEHGDNFLRGVTTIQPTAFLWNEVKHEDAAAKIINWA